MRPYWPSLTRKIRLAATTVAVAAMLLRALLPEGWMPGTTSSGMPELVICTMDQPVQAMPMPMMGQAGKMDMPGHGDNNHGDNGHRESCPFAAAPHVAAPASLPVLAEASITSVRFETPDSLLSVKNARHHTPQAPRAPPSLA
jgi:hypothetical protein